MRSLYWRPALGAAAVTAMALVVTACGSSNGAGGESASKPAGAVTSQA